MLPIVASRLRSPPDEETTNVINNEGFDKSDLKAKQTELAAMLGRST
jgi:hypothetical protein